MGNNNLLGSTQDGLDEIELINNLTLRSVSFGQYYEMMKKLLISNEVHMKVWIVNRSGLVVHKRFIVNLYICPQPPILLNNP
jgi:hypothetical protein